MSSTLMILAGLFAALSILSLFAAVTALRRRRYLGGTIGLLLGLLLLSLSGIFGMITAAIQGYQALVREEVAAIVEIQPVGPQTFNARFRMSDGTVLSFLLAGDEISVDAHILKWKPIANYFGLHTTYALDRVAGRYARLEDERSKPHTVFPLADDKPVDLYRLRQKYFLLSFLLDAQYGSGTFVAADQPGEIEVRVSTSGLLIRPSIQDSGNSSSPVRSGVQIGTPDLF